MPEGLVYWPSMGTGLIKYEFQTATLSATTQNYRYVYDPTNYQLLGWAEHMPGRDVTVIAGQEVGPDGKVYLMEKHSWTSGVYQVDPVLKVYDNV